ncbi:extended synaptotagmin-2-like isoform X2 [Amphibalanus amphitrite]|uniref:extended synaptotagmin-2-like isoform X2 n=1 Tax=Amphibalanus amphitrite TaxID=1232801 RepID=UPI001C90E467|nr:extended synaptotagmin-2-like isoform X2 [Amphibalanus amphitrite]XP_043243291.1 extended synaptotagmin-2-like isoform X2 [Amphibalanus amphitrite]
MSDADGGAAGGSGSLGMLFLRRTAAILGIYAVGYLELSPAWLVGGIILSVMREKWSRQKKTKRELARAIALNSEQVTLAKLQDLPSWVHFPDVERAEWLNKMLKQMWPYVGDYVKNLLKTQFEASLAATMSGYKLYNFKFEKIYLGDIPPRVGGVKVYSDNVQRSEIIMDLEIFYAGDSRIECSFSRMTAGIKDFQLHGVMRIVYKPLISSIPIIGGMQLFFLNNPDIDFNMLGVADVLDMPGLSGILRNVIVDTIAAMMVLPNKWPIILSDQVPTKMVTASQPKGVLRLRLIEGKDLMKKDRNIFGQGKSDPYAIIYIGAKQFKTKYIQDTVDPVWNYVCEFALLESVGPRLWVELSDSDDPGNKDDNLGRCGLDVADIAKAGSQDLWVPLEQARSGRIHLKLDWLSLSTNVADIKKQLNEIEDLSAFDHSGLHSAVLTVFVDSAKKLPMASRAVEPDPLVRLVLGNQKEATSCKYRTLDPVWEEGFSFLVKNPLTQTMTLEVEDQSSGKSLGSMQLELKSLLREADLSVTEQPHTLYNSGPQSKVVLSIQLRILTHDKVAPEDLEGKIPSAMPLRPVAPAPPPAAKPDTDAASGKTADPAQPTAVPDPTPAVPKPAAKTDDVPPSPPSPVKKETKKRESKVEPVPAETREEVETLLQDLSTDSPVTETSGLRQRKPENPAGADRLGRIQLTLRYSTTRGRLVITVHKVANLPMQGDDIPDPYVKTYLLPDRSEKNKRKTEKLTDNCDPVYEETFEYKGPLGEAQLRTLEVLVVSKKTFARNPVIGMKHIDLRGVNLEAGTTEWFDLEPEERFDSSHPKPAAVPEPKPAAVPEPKPSSEKQEPPQPTAGPIPTETPASDKQPSDVTSPGTQPAETPQKTEPTNSAGADGLGRVELTLRHNRSKEALEITVHRVVNLPMQGDDIPDPYVKTYLLPDRSEKNKRKTKKLTDNCDPVFEETFEYKGPLSESQLRTLEVLVVSKKTFARNPVIGMKHIDLRGVDLEAGTTEWFDLEPEERFESSHPKYDPYSSPAPPPAAPPVPEPEVKQETPYPAPAGSGKTAQESESAEPVPVAAPLVEPPPAASTQPAKPPQHLGGADKLGRIQLTLKYNQARCALAVVVHKVTNLPMQGDDIPDPYVKTYLLPDRSEKNKRKTQKFKDNCNPVYEETLEYEGKLHELLRTLEVQVVSKKTFAPNPILGMKHIDLKSFDLENGMTLWFDLEPEDRFDESEAKPSTPAYDPYSRPPAAAAPPPVAEQPKQKPVTPQESAVQSLIQDLLPEDIPLREDPPGQAAAPSQSPPHPAGADRLGRIELTLRYSHMKDALEVTVHRVANLPVQGDDIPDPYVKTYLLPDKSGSNKRKTEKFKDECNPVYEETFEYKGKQSDVGSRTLEVQVVSKKTFGWNPVLGMKHIDLRGVNLEAGTTDWFDLEPEERFDS